MATFRRALLVLLGAILTISMLPASAFGAYYGVLAYDSQLDATDAVVVAAKFDIKGWTQEVYKNARLSSTSYQPYHYDFTHGYDDNQTQAGDDCDLLYVTGHGSQSGYLPISRYGSSTFVDEIGPDTTLVCTPLWEVGTDWAGLFPSNESRWDHEIEWAVMANCWQMYGGTPYVWPASAPTNSVAKMWARTLLGTPNRMHAIYGYRNVSYDQPTDTNVADRFFNSAFGGTKLADAWISANRAESQYQWAFATHTANRADYIHGVSSGATADTDETALYYVDYYYEGAQKRILDGRGGTYETQKSVSDITGSSTYSRTTFRVDVQPKGEGVRLSPGSATPRRLQVAGFMSQPAGNVDAELESYLGRVNDRPTEALVAPGAGGTDPEVAIQWDSGHFEYHSGRGVQLNRVRMTPEGAVDVAKHYLATRNAFPEDAVLAEVTEVRKAALDFDDRGSDQSEVVQYGVRFVQKVGDAYLDAPGTGIFVSVDDAGVNDVYSLWYDIEYTGEQAGEPIDSMSALNSAVRAAGSTLKLGETARVSHLDLVYTVDPYAGSQSLRPAWRVQVDEGAVFIDAATGKPVVCE